MRKGKRFLHFATSSDRWIIQAMKNELKDPATVEKLNVCIYGRRYEGVRARVGQPSIYNSCRFSFKYVLNVLINRQRIVK